MDKDQIIFDLYAGHKAGDLASVEANYQRFLLSSYRDAIKFGLLDEIKRLIDHGLDVNYADEKGASPLMHAVKKHDAEMVKWLSANGANANQMDANQLTAFLYMSNDYIDGVVLFENHYDYKDHFILITQHLLSASTDLLLKDNNGMTIFEKIMASRYCPEIKAMVKSYAENHMLDERILKNKTDQLGLEF